MNARSVKHALMVAFASLMLSATLPTSVRAADLKAVEQWRSISLAAAQQAAQTALSSCQKKGAMVAVVVVDRAGVPLVMLRDSLAGMHTPEAASRKAWTAVSFKNGTSELAKATAYDQASSGIRGLSNVAMIGGGIVIREAGSIIGAIGVSGAPNGEMDDACAKAGVDAIQEAIELN